MHFASTLRSENLFRNPKKYYRNNLINTINLLIKLLRSKIKYFIFSSSAAVYGIPNLFQYLKNIKDPINPYGNSKLIIENVLNDFNVAYGLKFISLRYF